jgi:hypothetical protein
MSFAAAKFRLLVMISGFAGLCAASSIPPIWTSAFGTSINSWDHSDAGGLLTTIDLGFEFPLFGVDYSSATLSSNGTLYFGGSPGNSEPQASASGLYQPGYSTIAPAWYHTDFTPLTGPGSIDVNNMANQVVITFDRVAPDATPVPQNLATFQVTLDSDGTVIFAYEALNSLAPASTNSLTGSSQAIVGISDGFGDQGPGSVNLSGLASGSSFTSASNTIYQLIDNNPPDNSNLAGLDLVFNPVIGLGGVQVGWDVTSGVPEPGTSVEMGLASLVLLVCWRGESFPIRLWSRNTHLRA